MSTDGEKIKEFATRIVTILKDLESEIRAYKLALATFKIAFPDPGAAFELALAKAKMNRAVTEPMREKYDVALEQFLEQISRDQVQVPELLAFLQSWRPDKDPVN